MEVVAWQIGILVAIVSSSVFFGNRGLAWSAGIASIWTVVVVFTNWLMILQFVTIVVAGIVGAVICDDKKSNARETRAKNWRALVGTGQLFLGLAVFGGIFLLYKYNPEQLRSFDFGSLGIAFSFGTALFGAAIVGGTVFWLVAGVGWRNWSGDVFRFGGAVVAVGAGLALVYGEKALQEVTTTSGGRESSTNVAPAQEVSRDDVVQTAPVDARRDGGNSYARLVGQYEKLYAVYDPSSPQYDAAIVNETLIRKAYYQFVDSVGDEAALQKAVRDMLRPPGNRQSAAVYGNAAGGCYYNGSEHRKIVMLSGRCPVIAVGSGLR